MKVLLLVLLLTLYLAQVVQIEVKNRNPTFNLSTLEIKYPGSDKYYDANTTISRWTQTRTPQACLVVFIQRGSTSPNTPPKTYLSYLYDIKPYNSSIRIPIRLNLMGNWSLVKHQNQPITYPPFVTISDTNITYQYCNTVLKLYQSNYQKINITKGMSTLWDCEGINDDQLIQKSFQNTKQYGFYSNGTMLFMDASGKAMLQFQLAR